MFIKEALKSVVVNSKFLSLIREKISIANENRNYKRRVRAYNLTNNKEIISQLKNSKYGKRCFIIGNGPSLSAEDLELIKDEISFAANRVWLMYDKTSWRPTYYMCQDWKMLLSEHNRISQYPETVFVGFDGTYEQNITLDNAIAYFCDKRPYAKREYPFPFSYECESYIVDGTIVTYSALQLALYMGFKEIYLLGVDNNYQYTIDKNKKITRHENVKETHFDERYKDLSVKDSKNKIFGISDPEMCNNAYESAKNAATIYGAKIYNATRGGKLDIYDRVKLEDIVG